MARFTPALCALVALSAPAFAHAQDVVTGTDVATDIHVNTTGMDLAKPADARAAYARIKAAAHEACHSDVSDPMTQNADKACMDKAVANAAGDLQSPMVMALVTGPKSDSDLLAARPANTQLATAADVARPAGAIAPNAAMSADIDAANVQPGAVRNETFLGKCWHAVTSVFKSSKAGA
jgi:UrcA family protein